MSSYQRVEFGSDAGSGICAPAQRKDGNFLRSMILMLLSVIALPSAIGLLGSAQAGVMELPTTCSGLRATITQVGGVVHGTGGNDVTVALDATAIYGYGGNDTICVGNSGPNFNTIDAGSGDGYVHGCAPRLSPAPCSYEARGGAGNDTILWFGYISGDAGDEYLLGYYVLSGRAGDDTLSGNASYGTLCDGGSGTDIAIDCKSTVKVP
jgi:hypothetical protein